MEFKASDYKPNEILKFIRQNSNMTQEELAHELKKSKNWVKNNEQGVNRYYFEDLIKVANLCNIEIIFKNKKKKTR
jgi:transcriptional regulator with XRE-family HTH domain